MKLDGNKLMRLRMKADLTQEQVAEKAGVSITTYNKAEAGGILQPLIAQRIVNVFAIEIEDVEVPDLPNPITAEAEAEAIQALKAEKL